MMGAAEKPDILNSETLIKPGEVSVEPATELIKVKAAVAIAAAALAIGVTFLGIALYMSDNELKAWATGLISLVVGAAIGFVFSSSNGGK